MDKGLIGRRIGAFILDQFLITIIAMIPFMIGFSNLVNDFDYFFTIFPISLGICVIAYLCKDIFGSRSLGKRVFNIYVVEHEDINNRPKIYSLILRNVTTFLWFIEFFAMIFDENGRRIGDKLAKTQVVGHQGKFILKIIMIIVFICALFFSGLFLGITQLIKHDGSYQTAVAYIKTHDEIKAEIGDVQGFGNFPSGSIVYTNASGVADLHIKVVGSQNSIVVNVHAEKEPYSEWVVKDINY